LVESEYNQLVEKRKEKRTFQAYVDDESHRFDFLKVADNWATYFGAENIICRIFERTNYDVIARFLSCLPNVSLHDLGGSELPEATKHLNKSIGYFALTKIMHSNRGGNGSCTFSPELLSQDLPALLFDESEAQQYRARFASSNAILTERYMGNRRADLGGRRFSDSERREIRQKIVKILDAPLL
jgi:hypothetical protein